MKHLVVATAFLALSASTVFALPGGGAGGSLAASATHSGGDHHQQYRKNAAVRALRREGLAIQAADGGALTPEHRTQLQTKLNAILAGNY